MGLFGFGKKEKKIDRHAISLDIGTEFVKALIFRVEGDVATVYVPWELNYYKEWFMIRRGLADMIIQHLGLNEVDYVEKHTGAKVSAELISPPAKEQAGEAGAGAAQTASEPKPEAESTGSSPA